MANLPRFKIVLIGPGATGKTTYTHRLMGMAPPTAYAATLGVDTHPIQVLTNRGVLVLDVWDTAGQDKFGGLRDGYYFMSRGAIFMRGSPNGQSQINRMRALRTTCEDIPVVVTEQSLTQSGTQFAALFQSEYLVFDSLNCTKEQLYKPIQVLLQKITGDPELEVLDTGLRVAGDPFA